MPSIYILTYTIFPTAWCGEGFQKGSPNQTDPLVLVFGQAGAPSSEVATLTSQAWLSKSHELLSRTLFTLAPRRS